MKILTRVGLIGDGGDRFLGRAVYTEMAAEVRSPSDALALAFGLPSLTDLDREALRFVALCTMSPDPRVWPVKLCRLLSSYGDATAGFFGAQLGAAGVAMGPGVTRDSAMGLAFVAAHRDQLGIDEAMATWRAAHRGRFAGFGVPFRPEDERLLALRILMAGHPLAERPFWKLHLEVVEAAARVAPEQPNIVIAMAAILLDVGVAPERCGVAVSTLMPHTFLAHALEAAETDGAALNALPASAVDYRGVAPRST